MTNLIRFNHKLYGKALIIPNFAFKVSNEATVISYILIDDETATIKHSGIWDAGLAYLDDNSKKKLKELGY